MVIELDKSKQKVTCKKVLIDWLRNHSNTIIAHHIIDAELYEYGKEMFGVYYSASTYHRIWCWLKKDIELLRENGLEIKNVISGPGKVNEWEVKWIDNVRNQQLKMELR